MLFSKASLLPRRLIFVNKNEKQTVYYMKEEMKLNWNDKKSLIKLKLKSNMLSIMGIANRYLSVVNTEALVIEKSAFQKPYYLKFVKQYCWALLLLNNALCFIKYKQLLRFFFLLIHKLNNYFCLPLKTL